MATPTSAAARAGASLTPVASHGDDPALGAQPLDDRRLVLRQDLGLDVVYAEPARHRLGRGPVIPGHHHQAQARGLQIANGPGGRRLDRVGDAEDAGRGPVHGHEDRGGAVLA